jgi:superfamily II DNA or RNA helicase/HKD family nuclease
MKSKLTEGFQHGFIDDNSQYRGNFTPRILTNSGQKSVKVLSTLLDELENCSSFWFNVAFITSSGVKTILQSLLKLQDKNIRGTIVISDYLTFSQPGAMKLLLQFKNIELRIVQKQSHHAKGYLFDHGDYQSFIVGSSNLTQNALAVNRELNILLHSLEHGATLKELREEFQYDLDHSVIVDADFIRIYEEHYIAQQVKNLIDPQVKYHTLRNRPEPNSMQYQALINLSEMRDAGKTKALVISATGTGKTYLAAFDVRSFAPKRMLFVIHRENIARKALLSFQEIIIDADLTDFGVYTGTEKNADVRYMFATAQTLSKEAHRLKFAKDHFDYIVIDESHHAGAQMYDHIIDYFEPKFLLGMTATPERTDGFDIYSKFDHNVAYEIRLHTALKADLLTPFHYFGISDLTVDGHALEEKADFNLLVSEERIDRIIESIGKYGAELDEIRGLIFCSKVEECYAIAEKLSERGYPSIGLTGEDKESARATGIQRLETSDLTTKIDFLVCRDIFNEGIDIPRINLILMLRPTESAIVFVQQLGRGLRKAENKEYLTVLDFIGNYKNNFLVPIALYGDTSFNKDRIRRCLVNGSDLIPGASTINFDEITKERIFKSLNDANLSKFKDLKTDFELLKFQLGRTPLMMDFIEHGSRDPFTFVTEYKSYYGFLIKVLPNDWTLSKRSLKILESLSMEVLNGKRAEEALILRALLDNLETQPAGGSMAVDAVLDDKNGFTSSVSAENLRTYVHNLNLRFATENKDGKLTAIGEINNFKLIAFNELSGELSLDIDLLESLRTPEFKLLLNDTVNASIHKHRLFYDGENCDGFHLYGKYSRKDVFRILGWDQNPLAQNVGGYVFDKDKTQCPIFVTYNKQDFYDYEDKFLSDRVLEYFSKRKRTLNSPEIVQFQTNKSLRIPLFIKKDDDEGTEFYYMGDISAIDDSYEQIRTEDGINLVKMRFLLKHAVSNSIMKYLHS